MFKVCEYCILDLRGLGYLPKPGDKLCKPAITPGARCQEKPRCFDQPHRIRKDEKELNENHNQRRQKANNS